MKTLLAVSGSWMLLPVAALANTALPNIDQVVSDHQIAVCQQDWDEAERQVSVLMALPSVTPALRQELVDLRQQYVLYKAHGTQLETAASCADVVVEPSVNEASEAPLAPLGFGNTFDGPPPPLSSLGTTGGSGIPVPTAQDSGTIVIASSTVSPLTVSGIYHRGNVVYGTLVNNTGSTVRDVQILASLFDSGVGFAHSAQYTYSGTIFPGGRVEVAIPVEGAGGYGEPGGFLSNPQFEIWATGF